jgi:mannose/cellobiose epimerase-like protein (N-acyl-D-glucosamine 2-epimerase family)
MDIFGLYTEIKQHLEQGIIPFWLARAWDADYGGFLTNFDEDGHALDTPEKYLNTQARLVWWFSALSRRYPARSEFRDLAHRGVDFLLAHFWDSDYGGWYWKIHRDGSRLDDGKVVYGQSFAIYALSEYALVTGDPRGLSYAAQTFDLLQKYCADTRFGGYYENLEPDWTVSAPGFCAGDRKGLDTHMHLMEAFTTLYAASGLEIHRRKLLEVLDLIAHAMIDPATGCGHNQFTLDFTPTPAIAICRTWNAEREGDAPAIPTDTTSYGHNVELAWLMRRALQTARADPDPYTPAMRRLVEHACDHGVDWELGGIYRDGTASGGPLIKDKEFWQNAEVLVGFLDAYEAFGDARFLDAFENVWRFVTTFMINHGVGEWRTLLDRVGKSIDPKIGNPWKVAYHSGRSMLECSVRLARLRRVV